MANRYFRNTGNTSWGVTSNWSATDGGGSVGFTPNNADDVFFTANSGNCVLNTVGVAKSVTLTGFTGTLTMTNALQVYGNLTFYPGNTIAGLSGIEFYGNGILTSNG